MSDISYKIQINDLDTATPSSQIVVKLDGSKHKLNSDDTNFQKVNDLLSSITDHVAVIGGTVPQRYVDELRSALGIVPAPAAVTAVASSVDDLRRATNLTDLLVSFDYTKSDGTDTRVDDAEVSLIHDTLDGHTVLVVIRTDGETRSYRSDRLRNLNVSDNVDLAAAPVNPIQQIRDALNADKSVTAEFNFIRVNGQTGFVAGVEVQDVRDSDKGNEIVVGKRVDGSVRHYRTDRISNVVVTVTDKNRVLEDVDAELEEGGEPVISFNYTKLDGTPRVVNNFEVEAHNNGLLIGIREDGETRAYRVDRIRDLRWAD